VLASGKRRLKFLFTNSPWLAAHRTVSTAVDFRKCRFEFPFTLDAEHLVGSIRSTRRAGWTGRDVTIGRWFSSFATWLLVACAAPSAPLGPSGAPVAAEVLGH